MSSAHDNRRIAARSPCDLLDAEPRPGARVLRSFVADGDTLALSLTGEVDRHSVAPVRAVLAVAAGHGITNLRLDTSGVTFADSGLLDVLDTWSRLGRLELTATSPAVRRLLAAATAKPVPSQGTLLPPPLPLIPARHGPRLPADAPPCAPLHAGAGAGADTAGTP